jgi:low molecular weight protein-tyrosine phosphatase
MKSPSSEPFRVLVVCTANRYRSVLAEFMLRDRAAAAGLEWVVTSAGTSAVAGQPLDRDVVQLLAERGIPPTPWSSSVLRADAIQRADLVLGAARAHRAAVVTLVPSALRHAFTLRQFAGLLGVASLPSPDADGPQLVAAALAARGCRPMGPPERDDIADPVSTGWSGLTACAADVDAVTGAIVAAARSGTRP